MVTPERTPAVVIQHRQVSEKSAIYWWKDHQITLNIGKDRQIEIVLEPLSPSSTRMRVIARNGSLLYDSATATEIVLQTERVLGS